MRTKQNEEKLTTTTQHLLFKHQLDAGETVVREGFKKSKWKFKMAFAMRGGGSRGGLECHLPILKNDFC